MARSVLPVCNHAVWSKCGTKSVHKINETRNSIAKRPGCSNDNFSRRYTSSRSNSRNNESTRTHDYKSTRVIRVFDKLQKVNSCSNTENPLLGDAHRLDNDGIYLTNGKIRKYSKRVSESFEDTTTFHQANITSSRSPRIHSPSHLVSSLTLSPYPVVTDRVSTSNVRFRHASESLQRGEIRLDLVDKQSTITERKSYSPSDSRFDNLFGCIQNRMGSILGDSSNRRPMEHSRVPGAYKHPGAQGSLKDQSKKVICLKIDNSTAVAYLNNKGGTHSHQLLHLTLEIWKWCETKHIYLLAQHVPGRNNVIADEESRKMKDHNDWKIDSTVIQPLIKECQIDLFASRLTRQLNKYVSWRPDPGAIHVDAFTMNWTNLIVYAFPPFNLIPAVLHKTKKEMATLILIAPLWSAQPWRPLLIDLVIDYPVYLGNNSNLLTDVSHPKTTHPLFPALKLAVWRISGDISKQQAFLQQLSTCMLTKSVKTSTTKTYNCSWSQWSSWCEKRESDPVLAPVSEVLTFLAEQFAEGKQYRTINVLRSAISSAHVHVDSKPIGQHPLVVRLMRGVSICRPPQPRYQHTWNVAMVTEYLSRLGGNDNLSEKQLAQKLCMLMALTCPERSSILASLNIKYLKYFPEGVKFQHTIFRKRSHNGKLGESVFPKFADTLLCPVACLSTYLDRTKKWRKDKTDIMQQNLFLSFKKPHKPVTSATLSRWLKEVIRQSGIKDIFGGHSVRSASTSTAKKAGLSIDIILDMADWTSPSTFNLFYYKPTLPVSYGTSVLSQK